jgi:hypothetical protein
VSKAIPATKLMGIEAAPYSTSISGRVLYGPEPARRTPCSPPPRDSCFSGSSAILSPSQRPYDEAGLLSFKAPPALCTSTGALSAVSLQDVPHARVDEACLSPHALCSQGTSCSRQRGVEYFSKPCGFQIQAVVLRHRTGTCFVCT